MPCVTPPQLRPLAGDDQLVIATTAAPDASARRNRPGRRRPAGALGPQQDRARAVGLDHLEGRGAERAGGLGVALPRQAVAAHGDGRVPGGLRGGQRRPLEPVRQALGNAHERQVDRAPPRLDGLGVVARMHGLRGGRDQHRLTGLVAEMHPVFRRARHAMGRGEHHVRRHHHGAADAAVRAQHHHARAGERTVVLRAADDGLRRGAPSKSERRESVIRRFMTSKDSCSR